MESFSQYWKYRVKRNKKYEITLCVGLLVDRGKSYMACIVERKLLSIGFDKGLCLIGGLPSQSEPNLVCLHVLSDTGGNSY